MSKKRQTTQQTQSQNYSNTNSYGFLNAPDTADINALRDFKFMSDPNIGYSEGAAQNRLANSFQNPLGGNYSPQMRDQILRSGSQEIGQQYAQLRSADNQALQGQRFGQRATVASLTAPRLVQTGSSGSGTSTGNSNTVQSGGLLESLIGGAATGAAA